LSGLSKSIETVPLLANIVVFPMLFLGNVFFAGSSMPPWLRAFADYLPLTFFSGALRGVTTDGLGIADIKHDLIGMAVWAVILISLATNAFRFQDKEGS
jgi:ABC-type multidrug transport system permease subunit